MFAARVRLVKMQSRLQPTMQTIPAFGQVAVLKRIPEKMDPSLYYEKFRPYIRFFENVVYEGVPDVPIHHRGETGAQSSIVPTMRAPCS